MLCDKIWPRRYLTKKISDEEDAIKQTMSKSKNGKLLYILQKSPPPPNLIDTQSHIHTKKTETQNKPPHTKHGRTQMKHNAKENRAQPCFFNTVTTRAQTCMPMTERGINSRCCRMAKCQDRIRIRSSNVNSNSKRPSVMICVCGRYIQS